MKKIAVVILLGGTLMSCSKKEVDANAETNVMLEEPAQTQVSDSTAQPAAAKDTAAVASANGSTTVVDSTSAK